MNLKIQDVKDELDGVLNTINPRDFIENDPISIPKRFVKKQDIEISAFFAAILAWGQRKTIIKNTNKLMGWMGEEPHRFIMDHSDADLKVFESFVHRTFNSTDCLYFIEVLKQFYLRENSLENYFKGDTVPFLILPCRNLRWLNKTRNPHWAFKKVTKKTIRGIDNNRCYVSSIFFKQ